jgi:hypothetical protein
MAKASNFAARRRPQWDISANVHNGWKADISRAMRAACDHALRGAQFVTQGGCHDPFWRLSLWGDPILLCRRTSPRRPMSLRRLPTRRRGTGRLLGGISGIGSDSQEGDAQDLQIVRQSVSRLLLRFRDRIILPQRGPASRDSRGSIGFAGRSGSLAAPPTHPSCRTAQLDGTCTRAAFGAALSGTHLASPPLMSGMGGKRTLGAGVERMRLSQFHQSERARR